MFGDKKSESPVKLRKKPKQTEERLEKKGSTVKENEALEVFHNVLHEDDVDKETKLDLFVCKMNIY